MRIKVTRMAENKDELLQHYRRTREGLMSAIAGLSDEQMSEPSLDGWSVKDHLAHIALWDDLRATEVERVSAGHASAWKFSEAQEDAYNEVGYELRRRMSAAQAKWELERSRKHLLDAISEAKRRAALVARGGTRGLDQALADGEGNLVIDRNTVTGSRALLMRRTFRWRR